MKYASFVPLALSCLVSLPVAAQQAYELPDVGAVYHKSASGTWTLLGTNLLKPELRGGLQWILAVGNEHCRVRLDGAHAAIQLADSRPTFYVTRLPPNYRALIVRLSVRDSGREVTTRGIGAMPQLSFRPRDVVEAEMTPSGNVFAVRPREDLKPGEYMLVTSALPGAKWMLMGSEFGISR
jgi:hypothetical protein